MIAFELNAKLNGVSFVPECTVVLIVQRVLGIFSTHKPLASSSLFFNDSKIFLLADSTCPLVYVWKMDKGLKAICRLLQNYEILSPFN